MSLPTNFFIGRGGSEKLWYTDHGSSLPTWNYSAGSYLYNVSSRPTYSGGVDTYGHYGLFGFRSGTPLEVIDLETGALVYTYSDGTLNQSNGYGVSMDSTRGMIYFHVYSSTEIIEISLNGDFTPTSNGSKGTFNVSSQTNATHTTTYWGWRDNDGAVHIHRPEAPTHTLHDKLVLFSRADPTTFRIANAGNRTSQSTANSYHSVGKYGTGYDWSSDCLVYTSRNDKIYVESRNGSHFNGNGRTDTVTNYMPSGWTQFEDAFVRNNGDLVVVNNGSNRQMFVYPRA